MKIIMFVPVKDYLKSRKRLFVKFIIPILIAAVALVFSMFFNIVGDSEKISLIFSDFVSTQINIIAILISFSVAIITILVSADNKNIEMLKETESMTTNYKSVDGKRLSLFQVLLSNITYNVVIEIFYLLALIAIALVQSIFPICLLKGISKNFSF